ncbi:MAG: sigma-70 family RNA polymerase sigma factor [Saccharofermentanales bacterium]|jgi:RNA polymerase sigma factor (sigma-70 family)
MPRKQREKCIEEKFDSYCKICLRNEARDMYRAQQKQREREVNFSDLYEAQLQATPFQYWDAYDKEFAEFQLFDGTIVIHSELLANLLDRLSPFNRNIILMSIWMEMSDREIGEHLHISRSSVQYKRTNILREMREVAEEKDEEKESRTKQHELNSQTHYCSCRERQPNSDGTNC